MTGTQGFPCLNLVQMAESVLIKSSQRRYFSNDLKILEKKGILNKKSRIYNFDPYLNRCGLLRVGGRIQKSTVSEEMKHLVLLARNSEIAVMIIRWCHEKVAHSGRGITMNYIRPSGYWIINCNTAVRFQNVSHTDISEYTCSSKRRHLSQVIGCVSNLFLPIIV